MQLLGKRKQANKNYWKKKEKKREHDDMGIEPLTLGLSVVLRYTLPVELIFLSKHCLYSNVICSCVSALY